MIVRGPFISGNIEAYNLYGLIVRKIWIFIMPLKTHVIKYILNSINTLIDKATDGKILYSS